MANWTANHVKIGRRSDVDIAVTGDDPDTIAYRVHKAIRDKRLLASRELLVEVEAGPDPATCQVGVWAGGRRVADFTLVSVDRSPDQEDPS